MARLTRQTKAAQVAVRPPSVARAAGWGAHPLHALWRVSPGRVAFYLDQLGELLNAGVNMHEAMLQLGVHTPDGRLRRMSQEMAQGASAGQSLATQLERYPQLMPPQVRGMILAAERSGSLPAALGELAAQLREQQIARWKVLLAAVWFGFLVFVAAVIVPLGRTIMVTSAAQIESLKNNEAPVAYVLRVALPAVKHQVLHVFLPLGALLLVVWFLGKLIFGLPALQRPLQRLLYHIPVIGNLIRRAAMIRFLVSLSALMKAGVEIQEGMGLAAEATGDAVMTGELQLVEARLRAGQPVEQALRDCRCLSREVKESLFLAQRAGSYDRTLDALIAGARDARRRAVAISALTGYGLTMLASAALVLIVAYVGYTTYFNTILHVWDE